MTRLGQLLLSLKNFPLEAEQGACYLIFVPFMNAVYSPFKVVQFSGPGGCKTETLVLLPESFMLRD